jgi:hypothetical protein
MIDIAQLRLEAGIERSLDVPVALPDIIIGGVTYSGPAAPAIARVDITRLISGLLMRMRLSSTITGPCHRCLEEAAVPVSIDAREYQADHPEKGAEAEEVCDYLEGDDLDVATWAADDPRKSTEPRWAIPANTPTALQKMRKVRPGSRYRPITVSRVASLRSPCSQALGSKVSWIRSPGHPRAWRAAWRRR